MEWYGKEFRFFPLWCVPYKRVHDYEWLAPRWFERNGKDELFLDLARQADVVLDNYRLGVRDRLGIGHADLLAVNPRLISVSVTTYGSRGEETKRPGFDPLLQAHSGMMAAQGGDNDEPVFHVIAVNDFASASMAAFGVIAALSARQRTGEPMACMRLTFSRMPASASPNGE